MSTPNRWWNVRLRFEPRDLWIGIYWDRRRWFAGFHDAYRASASNAPPDLAADRDSYAHRAVDIYICLVPMLPIHIRTVWCPRPDGCIAGSCPIEGQRQRERDRQAA